MDNQLIGYIISGIVGLLASSIPILLNRPKTRIEIAEDLQGMLREALAMQKSLQSDKEGLEKQIKTLKEAKTADYDLHIRFSLYPEVKIKISELRAVRPEAS